MGQGGYPDARVELEINREKQKSGGGGDKYELGKKNSTTVSFP